MEARVTLKPGSKGTKKLTEQFGERLVCVRYRYDVTKKRRLKTVEIVVDEAPWEPVDKRRTSAADADRPQRIIGVRVAYEEGALQQTVREAGGRWDRGMRLWLLPLSTARILGLHERVVQVIPRQT